MQLEESIEPSDAACVALRVCLQELSRWPNERALIETARGLVSYLRGQGRTTFTAGELNRIDIGLALSDLQSDREGSEALTGIATLRRR